MSGEATALRTPIEVRAAIEEIVAEHAWLIDHGMADRLPDLYTEDGRMLGVGEDLIGRAAITAWSVRRAAMRERTSRHVCSNIRLTMESPVRARGTVVLTVYRRDTPSGPAVPLMVGDYNDIYERGADGHWRFAERALVAAFSG